MDYLCLFLWIITNEFLGIRGSSCILYEKCLDDLRTFSQVDEFHVYQSLEETGTACSEAKNAYLCILSAPECKNRSRMVQLSPILKGSSRLLKDFCGFKSRRRPCCALRDAFLEHRSCYEEVGERLNDCNDKYRISLDKILTITEELEQKKQRFCAVEWYGSCMKSATQSYCGKAAAQVIKSFAVKAGKPDRRFLIENENCDGTPYGNQDTRNFCEEKQLYKCHIHLLFLHEYLAKDRVTEEETVLSLCTGIHDSLECLNQAFKRCVFSHKVKKLEEMPKDEIENEACLMKEGVLQRYRGKINCLATRIRELSQCQPDFYSGTEFVPPTVPFTRYKEYFCRVLKGLETCWISKASSYCGKQGREVMSDIVELATVNIHRNCVL